MNLRKEEQVKKRILMALIANFTAFMCFAAEISLNLLPEARTSSQAGALRAATNLSTEEDVVREHRLGVGAANVQKLAVGDVLILALFEDREVRIELVSEERSFRGRAFLGRDRNGLGLVDCVVLETERGLVVDVTDSKNNRVWKVISDENGVQVKEVKPTLRMICPSRPLQPPGLGTPVPVVDVTVKGGVATAVTNRLEQSVAPDAGATQRPNVVFRGPLKHDGNVASADVAAGVALPTIDILVVYDLDAASWAKSNGGGIQSFAETSVQKMNTAIANTGLNSKFSFRLVGTYEVGGSAGGGLEYALKFASGEYQGTLNGVSWAGVQQKRDEIHADIVCVLIDTGGAYGTTGLGWSLMPDSDPASCGCNATSIRAVSQSHTMTHEVGHNMGAGHSDQMADKGNCGPQYHSYSSGYYFTANGTKYYTIMAYNTDGYGNYYTEVPYFSSPDYKYNGVAVGDATHNNSLTLSLTYSTIVNNRKGPVDAAQVGAAIGASDYEWTTSGEYPWSVISDASTVGTTAARSCEMAGRTMSWLRTTVIGPATLSFDYQMRTYGGRFAVTSDSTVLFERQNEAIPSMAWASKSVSIPSGSHVVEFAYTHPGTGYTSGWGNGVRLDNVVFAGGSSPAQTYTISFDANGGSPTPSSITRKANEAYGTLPTPTRTGYALAGWYTAASGGTKVSSTTKATANATLYAHWTANTYSITYALNGGTQGTTHPTGATYDSAFSVSAPTHAGYTFAGWTVTSGLNKSTAKWGTSSSPATAISGTSTKCVNGATGNVYFKNLTATANGSVTLTASWTAQEQDSSVAEVMNLGIDLASGGRIYMLTFKNGRQIEFSDDWLADAGIDVSGGITASLMNAIGRNGLPRYQSYLFGLEPESAIPAEEQLKPTITFDANGMPVISCTPRNDNDLITYKTLGKTLLNDAEWVEVPPGSESAYKFFKVRVELSK